MQRLGQDGLHHAPGLMEAGPARVRMEACARARVALGSPRKLQPPRRLDGDGLLMEDLLWALCQEFVRSTTQRFVIPSGAGLPFSEISASSPRSSSRSQVTFES